MTTISISGAGAAPGMKNPRAARIAARVNVSDAVAGAMALLAYGEPRRGDLGALAALTSARCAAAGVVARG